MPHKLQTHFEHRLETYIMYAPIAIHSGFGVITVTIPLMTQTIIIN